MGILQNEKPEWNVWERICSGAGIVFALLLIYGFALEIGAGFPPTGDSAKDISQYFTINQPAFKKYLWSALATIPFQICFFSALFIYIRRSLKSSIWPVIGIVSVAVGNTATLFTNVVWGALTLYGSTISDASLLQVLWIIYHLSGFTLGLISFTILLGFGLEMVRLKPMWRGIGYLGIITGIYEAVVWVISCYSNGKPSPIGGLSYILFIIWILLAGFRLTFGPSAQPLKKEG
jgi:hypothetical protein